MIDVLFVLSLQYQIPANNYNNCQYTLYTQQVNIKRGSCYSMILRDSVEASHT